MALAQQITNRERLHTKKFPRHYRGNFFVVLYIRFTIGLCPYPLAAAVAAVAAVALAENGRHAVVAAVAAELAENFAGVAAAVAVAEPAESFVNAVAAGNSAAVVPAGNVHYAVADCTVVVAAGKQVAFCYPYGGRT